MSIAAEAVRTIALDLTSCGDIAIADELLVRLHLKSFVAVPRRWESNFCVAG